jgi:hypothetical protein
VAARTARLIRKRPGSGEEELVELKSSVETEVAAVVSLDCDSKGMSGGEGSPEKPYSANLLISPNSLLLSNSVRRV